MFPPFCSIILSLILVTTYPVFAQNKMIEEIVPIIKAGSSRDLAKFFDNTIELNMNTVQGDYSRSQAELVVRDFFKKFPPKDFQVVKEGETASNIRYYIAYYTCQEQTFRVLIKTKELKDKPVIFSIDFKKD